MIIVLLIAYVFGHALFLGADYFGYLQKNIDVYDRWVDVNLTRQYGRTKDYV